MMDYAARLRDDRFVVFLFHGVIERQVNPVRNYTRKHLEKDYFAEALRALLAAGGRAASLDDVVAAHQNKDKLPRKSFVITFDDGFLNNLTVAAPILADLNIPATFYVTSDFIESNRMSWIDRIEWAVEPAAAQTIHLPWNAAFAVSDAASKRCLLDAIRAHAKHDEAIERDELATQIQLQLDAPETWSQDGPLDQKMSWANVRTLDSSSLFRVGGHSHTHAILSFLDPENLTREITTSLGLLRDKADVGPRHYSYPEGLAHCYSEGVISTLKAHGVVICPTAEDGDNAEADDLFRLKRVMAL